MKVFITGANGMLGSAITRAVLARGHEVKCLIKPGTENHNLDGLQITEIKGDLTDEALLKREIAGQDAVINVAASTQIYPRKGAHIWKVNFECVKMLAEICLQNNISRFIQIGTANSFPEGSKSNPGNELGKFNADRFGMDYIDSKYAAQKYLLEQYVTNKLPVIIINPTYMIGPFDSLPTSGKMLQAFALGKLPGYTAGGKSFVCSLDVAAATANALQMGRTGECYIAAGENLSYREFFECAAEVLNKPFRMKKIPGFLVMSMGFLASLWARISGTRPQLSFGMAKISGVGQYYSNEKIVQELQMPRTPAKEAIRICLEWFRENKYI